MKFQREPALGRLTQVTIRKWSAFTRGPVWTIWTASVNLNVTSIASYLPSSTERGDNATFSGLTTNPVRLNLTPIEEAAICKSQIEKQLEDAKNRNLLWPVEDVVELGDLDAVGEDDPDYIRLPDGSFQLLEAISPIGIRNESGSIDAMPIQEETEEAHFGGVSESAPKHLREMVCIFLEFWASD